MDGNYSFIWFLVTDAPGSCCIRLGSSGLWYSVFSFGIQAAGHLCQMQNGFGIVLPHAPVPITSLPCPSLGTCPHSWFPHQETRECKVVICLRCTLFLLSYVGHLPFVCLGWSRLSSRRTGRQLLGPVLCAVAIPAQAIF